MKFAQFKNWIKTHKLATVGIVIGILIVGVIGMIILTSFQGARRAVIKYPEAPLGITPYGLPKIEKREEALISKAPEIEVKEGSMEIKSKEAEGDFEKMKEITKEYEGYVERSTKSITNLAVLINATIRVPFEKFTNLIERLKKEFDVKSYDIKNYRISIEKELDELEILNRSLADYENIRKEIGEMRANKEKIELLMNLTDRELELKEKEKNYKRELSAKERMGDYATLNVSVEQDKAPKIFPENVFNRFKNRIKGALDNVITILMNLVGGGIELFAKAIQIVVYVFIIGIVFGAAYKIAQILYRKYWKVT